MILYVPTRVNECERDRESVRVCTVLVCELPVYVSVY